MSDPQLSRNRLFLTGLTAVIVWATLLWQQLTTGVPSHHLLHNPDLPAFSNWWGALLLPLLTWLFVGIVHRRMRIQDSGPVAAYPKDVIIGFGVSTLYGFALSQSFLAGYSQVASALFFGIPVIGFFLRVYRAEYVLGFILSMSFVFGAILSTIFGSLIALISYVAYTAARLILSLFRNERSSD